MVFFSVHHTFSGLTAVCSYSDAACLLDPSTFLSSDCDTAEHVAGAAHKVAEAESTAQAAQLQLTQAEARAESAEQAKIELSLKLAEAIAQTDTGSDVSGMPSNKASEAGTVNGSDSLQKRFVELHHLHVRVCLCLCLSVCVCVMAACFSNSCPKVYAAHFCIIGCATANVSLACAEAESLAVAVLSNMWSKPIWQNNTRINVLVNLCLLVLQARGD